MYRESSEYIQSQFLSLHYKSSQRFVQSMLKPGESNGSSHVKTNDLDVLLPGCPAHVEAAMQKWVEQDCG